MFIACPNMVFAGAQLQFTSTLRRVHVLILDSEERSMSNSIRVRGRFFPESAGAFVSYGQLGCNAFQISAQDRTSL